MSRLPPSAILDAVTVGRDWETWPEPYADAGYSPSRRLRLVQRHVASWLDERPGEALTVVGACAAADRPRR